MTEKSDATSQKDLHALLRNVADAKSKTPVPPKPSRFASRSPFNRTTEKPAWSIAPLYGTAVRFDLSGLGDPFHRLLGSDLNTEYGQPEAIFQTLLNDSELCERFEAHLDDMWESYQFKGAALIFPLQDSLMKAFTTPVKPIAPIKKKDAKDDEEGENEQPSDDAFQRVVRLRAIDIGLVFNVLARTRSTVLVSGTPLALEPSFLSQSLISDDPRLVALANATGTIEEVW